jgi:hypothetical protein
MKQKDILTLIVVGIIAFSVSIVLSGVIFNPPAKRSAKVPLVDKLSATFPDIKNDTNYNNFLNENALDPTLPIQIGNNNPDLSNPTFKIKQ